MAMMGAAAPAPNTVQGGFGAAPKKKTTQLRAPGAKPAAANPPMAQGPSNMTAGAPGGFGSPTVPNESGQMGGAPPSGPTPTGAPASGVPSYQATLDQQYGAGNPFGMQNWYGANPLETARASAQDFTDRNLAAVNARYGASGMGNSTRQALATGDVLGSGAAQLADVLAGRGQQAYAADADRGLSSLNSAGQLQLGQEQLPLAYMDSLMKGGLGLLDQSNAEQVPPWLNALLPYLNNFGTQQQTGFSQTRQA